MRFCGVLASLFVLLAARAAATQLTIIVLDPQARPVAGAIVELLPGKSAAPIAVHSTSAQGVVEFQVQPTSGLQVRILAPGFAAYASDDFRREESSITVHLRLAPVNQEVTVTATRTPVSGEAANSDVETL